MKNDAQLIPQKQLSFIKLSMCAGFDHDGALIALGDIARLLGVGVQAS